MREWVVTNKINRSFSFINTRTSKTNIIILRRSVHFCIVYFIWFFIKYKRMRLFISKYFAREPKLFFCHAVKSNIKCYRPLSIIASKKISAITTSSLNGLILECRKKRICISIRWTYMYYSQIGRMDTIICKRYKITLNRHMSFLLLSHLYLFLSL
jgi:hypothetical protein